MKLYVGYITLEGNDQDLRVFFNEEDEKELIEKYEFIQMEKYDDKHERTKYVLFNTKIGCIRYITYEEQEER